MGSSLRVGSLFVHLRPRTARMPVLTVGGFVVVSGADGEEESSEFREVLVAVARGLSLNTVRAAARAAAEAQPQVRTEL